MADAGRPRPRLPFSARGRGASANSGKAPLPGVKNGARRGFALRRQRRLPSYWRPLTPALAGANAVPEERVNIWLLVLAAKKVPHLFYPGGPRPRLYVPPLWEGVALHEIRAVEKERPIPAYAPPVRENVPWVFLFLLCLLIWHGLRFGWFAAALPAPPFPDDPAAWSTAFGLDMTRFRSVHEFWRTVTALCLHADDSHLFSNLGFGLIFLIPLCRRAGLGLGLCLTVLAGVAGNAANAASQPWLDALNPFITNPGRKVISIGFSTALFGSIGALCALNAADMIGHYRRFAHLADKSKSLVKPFVRRLLPPLAAGLALLGFLGGGAEARTDYSAHIWGFVCGLLVTAALLPLERKLFALPEARQRTAQGLLYAGVFCFLSLAWLYALTR